MNRPFQAISSGLLCLVLALGHSPAWLHIATCDHTHGGVVDQRLDDSKSPSDECSHCCGEHEAAAVETSDEQSHPVPGSEHDSDHCAVCQSLLNPGGVVSPTGVFVVCQPLDDCVQVGSERSPAESYFSVPQSRGPPVAVA